MRGDGFVKMGQCEIGRCCLEGGSAGSASQGMLAAIGSQKGQGRDSFLELPQGSQPS